MADSRHWTWCQRYADIFIENGVAVGSTINAGGRGYQVGDILTPTTIGSGLGDGIRVSISTIFGNNELNITDVQGEFSTVPSAVFQYTNSVGVTTTLDVSRNPTGVSINGPIDVVNDGLHMTINQRNHGMYSNTNRVVIRDVASTVPTTSGGLSKNATTNISVGTTAHLMNFEGVGVPSLTQDMSELVMKLSNTLVYHQTLDWYHKRYRQHRCCCHNENQRVSKYEFNGVSLRRINKTHNMNEVTASNPYDTDFYKIKINMALNGTNRTTSTIGQRFFEKDTIGGGPNARGTYNIPFSQVIPNFNTITPTGTSIDPTMRTISALVFLVKRVRLLIRDLNKFR